MSEGRDDEPESDGPVAERREKPSGPSPFDTRDIAFLDDLTGLSNRRFANRLLEDDWPALLERYGELSLILIDLDGFKEVNDVYGHAAGDEILKVVAGLLRQHFRQEDLVARYGGDEFLVALPGAGQDSAAALADRARAAVDATAFSTAPNGTKIATPLSFSMGVAASPADGNVGTAVVAAADRRLYEDKRARTRRRRPGRIRPLAWSLLILAALVAGALLGPWLRETQAPLVQAPAIRPRRSVAVLGFRNLSGRPEAAWLSTAFAEMLSAELAAVETLRLIPGESVARARVDLALPEIDTLAEDTLRRVRTRLGTDVVVHGSYLDASADGGRQIRLDVRLQDAKSGDAIGVVSQSGTPAELLEIVAKAGAGLRQALGASALAPAAVAEVSAARPGTTDAIRLYAQGLDRLRLFDALHARELLERASAADPDWPLAHSALAEAWMALGYDGRAKEAAQRAFELSGNLPREERLMVEARYREAAAEWDAAIRINATLFRLAPDDVDHGLSLARVQRLAGREAEARATLVMLRRLPPALSKDPRIDIAEAEATKDFASSQKAAARAGATARAQGARLFLARARLLEAWALGEQGRYVEATAAAQEARQIYAEAGDRGGLARALNRMATVRPNQDDLAAARATYEEAAAISRQVGDRRWTALVLNNLALTYSDTGDFARARPLYEEALRFAREVGSLRAVTIVVTNLGRDLNNLGRPAEGRVFLEEALAGYRKIADRGSEVYALNNLGNSAMSLGDLDLSQRLYEEALPISAESGERRIRAYTLVDLGEIHYWRGNLSEARRYLDESLALRRELGVNLDIAEGELWVARLALEEGDAKAAESLAREAAQVFEKEKGSTQWSARALLALALLGQGRGDEAAAAIAPASEAAPRLQHALIRLAVRTAEGRVLVASGRGAEGIRKLEAAVGEAARLGLVPESFVARLALGEARLRQGQAGAPRDALRTLAKDAEARGFLLVARRAAAAAGPT